MENEELDSIPPQYKEAFNLGYDLGLIDHNTARGLKKGIQNREQVSPNEEHPDSAFIAGIDQGLAEKDIHINLDEIQKTREENNQPDIDKEIDQ